MEQTKKREFAFKLIYSSEVQKNMDEEQVEIFLKENRIERDAKVNYIKQIFYGIKENEEEITKLIENSLKDKWTMDRVSKIDLSILKLAVFEMLYSKIEYKIVINEAIELAKKFSEDNSKSFINGILANIVKEKNLAKEEEQ